MSLRAALLAAALLLPVAGAADGERRGARFAYAAEGTVARYPEDPHLALGLVASARWGFGELVVVADWAARKPDGDAGFGSSALLGAGLALDASPLVSLHAHAVVGRYSMALRDLVYGGWRSVDEQAWGLRAGVRLHPQVRAVGLWPLAGAWLSVLKVDEGSSPIRGARWGGVVAVVGLTLGAEYTGPGPRGAPGP